MERQIGETFKVYDKKYEVVKGRDCSGCDLDEVCETSYAISSSGICFEDERTDKQRVVFKEVKGEILVKFFGIRIDEDIEITNKKETISIEQRVHYKLFDTEKQRQAYVIRYKNKCITFDITEDIMTLFMLETKEDVYRILKKEFQNSQKILKHKLTSNFKHWRE